MSDENDGWPKFLNPESLKQILIRSSLYLTCWEMLKQCVVDQPFGFYGIGWRSGRQITSPKYKTEVLNLMQKDVLVASALWFQNRSVISDVDVTTLRKLRDHRNKIAHELPNFLGTSEPNINMDYFGEIFHIVEKIDKWWIREIEIPTNPDLEGHQFTDTELDGVLSSRMISMRLLIEVAHGNEEHIRSIYEEVKRAITAKGK